MAFSVNSGPGGGRRSRFRNTGTLSEMNVVPLVDVMMVLLVIFMLTAHVMDFGMEVEVPKVKQVKDSADELPVITITKNGVMTLNDKDININEIGPAVRKQFGEVKAVYVRADKDTIWDPIAQVVSALDEAKINVRMVTQPVDEADQPRRRR
ncbi:MAG TPA: biopolymer transporter ExbD [Bryobacteraceae bacterium]|nr:biopolymer transporter ExbD [Bryobacteraceae bacterium]